MTKEMEENIAVTGGKTLQNQKETILPQSGSQEDVFILTTSVLNGFKIQNSNGTFNPIQAQNPR